jgi:hypothetical protein
MPDTSVSLYDALHEPIVLAHIAALIAALLATYVACYPVVAFVRRGWAITARRGGQQPERERQEALSRGLPQQAA